MNINGIFGILQTEKAEAIRLIEFETSVRNDKRMRNILLKKKTTHKQTTLESNTPLR
jgi:hypothetical protein